MLAAVAVRNTSLTDELTVNNSEPIHLCSKGILSFAAKAMGFENASLVLTQNEGGR